MLNDPKEIEIISKARQKNVRDPKRSREHFYRIFNDFFVGVTFEKGQYIDLGAGQFDFCEIIKNNNGFCTGVDNDPAVIELGIYKQFDVIQADIKKISKINILHKFDGVFNKFSLNAFWFWTDDSEHELLIDSIANLVKPGGWAWIAPWNGIPKHTYINKEDVTTVLDLQKRFFAKHGFTYISLDIKKSKYYGINGNIANNIIFLKNLTWKG